MLQGIILRLALSYIASAITKFEQEIDWGAIKSSLDSQLQAMLPGWIEEEAQVVVDNALVLVEDIAGTPGIVAKIIELVSKKDFAGVISYLEQLLVSKLQLVGTSTASAAELVAAYKKS